MTSRELVAADSQSRGFAGSTEEDLRVSAFVGPEPSWWDATRISPELRALLACGRAVLDPDKIEEFKAAVSACPSGDDLCAAAIAHGMLGHVHKLASAILPAESALARRLRDLQRLSGARSLHQTAQLVRLLDALEAAGVPAMAYKGPVWADSLYGDITLRAWVDLDLIVKRDQVSDARDVLLAKGYRDADRFNDAYIRRRWGSWGELELQSVDASSRVELHWEVSVSIGAHPLSGETLLARAGWTHLLGRRVLAPSPVDALMIDSIHGAKHRWDSIERTLGMALRIQSTYAGDWPRILFVAREAECSRRLVIAVAHACGVFALPTPPEVSGIVARRPLLRKHLRALGSGSLEELGFESAREKLTVLLTGFATEDSLANGLRHAATRFFCPGREDWEAVPLPAALNWLYYPMRPGRLALKWIGRFLHLGQGKGRAP